MPILSTLHYSGTPIWVCCMQIGVWGAFILYMLMNMALSERRSKRQMRHDAEAYAEHMAWEDQQHKLQQQKGLR